MTDAKEGTTTKKWFPLESNPTLMNSYVQKLGFDTSHYEFVDVYSTEEWALSMIPQPVAAVIMLYPLTDVQEQHRRDEAAGVPENGDSKVWFIKQRIGNACGTIGLLHSLLNTPEGIKAASIVPDSWLSKFYQDCPLDRAPVSKAERLEEDSTIETLHDSATTDSSNQTLRGERDDDVITHFIALVHVDGGLYELDGRKKGPVYHGGTSEFSLLQDSCRIVETFMNRDPDEMRFTILALAPKME